ncbi:MAG: type II toxin-antitoxin system RelE/ParE family toxin [Devosia sp.]|nr:type II toxin-antitoxin system RelE/ParE family toxin [Devosia sp.]
MPHLSWSDNAITDLRRLSKFLHIKNPDAAKRAIRAIQEGVKILRQYPMSGRPMPDMAPEYRELLIGFASGGYHVFYRSLSDVVVILAIRHFREAGYSRE